MRYRLQVQKTKPGYKIVKPLFGKEIEIPKEWQIDEIQNHAKITTGSKNTQDKIEDGKYPFFVRSQKMERINSYSYDGEAVLTAGDGDIGKVFHYINGKFDFHQRVYKISDFSNQLDGYFFYLYFSKYFLERAISMSAKTTVDSIRMDMITKMLIPLPTFQEQKKIASMLGTVDDVINKYDEIIVKTKRLKTGLMQQLLTKGIGHKKFKKIKLLPQKFLEIPYEWNITTMEEVTNLVTYGLTVRPKYIESGVPLISAREISGGVIDYESAPKITNDDYKSLLEKCKGKMNDIFFSKTGTIGFVARVEEDRKFAITQNIALLRPNEEKILPAFLELFLRTKLFYSLVVRILNSTTIPDLQLGDLRKMKVFVPKVEEQNKLIEIFSSLKSEEYKTEKRLEYFNNLKKGLMQKLLTGQIQVN